MTAEQLLASIDQAACLDFQARMVQHKSYSQTDVERALAAFMRCALGAWRPRVAPDVHSSSIATARMGLPVPPLIFNGKPMNRKRPLPTSCSRLHSPSM
jgi:hypothetical protein